MRGLWAAILAGAISAAPAAGAETPLSEAEQLLILDKIGAAIAGKEDPGGVAGHFRKDAMFVGAADYPWDLAAFRQTLVSRDCSTDRTRSEPAERVLLGFTQVERQAARAKPSYGPGLIFYCVSSRRTAAHEIYTFRFEGRKISKVFFARAMVVPAPPPPPVAKGAPNGG